MKKYRPKFQWVLNEKLIGDETVQCKLKSLINMEKISYSLKTGINNS